MKNALHGHAVSLLLIVLLFGLCKTANSAEDPKLEAIPDWSINNGFNIIDYSNGITPPVDALHPKTWKVWLDGCKSINTHNNDSIVDYRWTITIPNQNAHVRTKNNCVATYDFPSQGVFKVTLRVTTRLGRTHLTTRYIEIKHYIVVSMGDSLASGEGNPDSLTLAGTPTIPLRWVYDRCHRSSWSGHTQAAAMLQEVFGIDHFHSAVTFISVACSGASIRDGIMGPYDGQDPPDEPHDRLPSQIEQIKRLLCQKPEGCSRDDPALRNIDALIVSVGANDVRFSHIVEQCAVPTVVCMNQIITAHTRTLSLGVTRHTCIGNDEERRWHWDPPLTPNPLPVHCQDYQKDVITGRCPGELPPFEEPCVPFRVEVKEAIEELLPERYDQLAVALRNNLKYSKVYITEYFDPTHNDSGRLCSSMFFEDAVADNFGGFLRFVTQLGRHGGINRVVPQ